MKRLVLMALCGMAIAGCASDNRATGGATTAPVNREDMRNSKDVAPGAEGDRQRPSGSTAPRSTY